MFAIRARKDLEALSVAFDSNLLDFMTVMFFDWVSLTFMEGVPPNTTVETLRDKIADTIAGILEIREEDPEEFATIITNVKMGITDTQTFLRNALLGALFLKNARVFDSDDKLVVEDIKDISEDLVKIFKEVLNGR